MSRILVFLSVLLLSGPAAAAAPPDTPKAPAPGAPTAAPPGPEVRKDPFPGSTNFAQVEGTVACAGAVTPAAIAEVKKRGFKSIFDLRLASEPGAEIDAEAAAARAAGIDFIHLPLDAGAPDPAVVDRFLKEIAPPERQPAFIHCTSGNRAAALWLVKRVMLDGWDRDRALAEASQLGLTKPAMQQFALDYLKARNR
jgi:uncharacterized protein (TIGR01244 family)